MSYGKNINWRANGYGPEERIVAGTPGVGVTAEHFTADGHNYVTKLTVNGVLPAIAGGAALGVGLLAYTFPAGVHMVQATRLSLALTAADGNVDADTPEISLGTVIVTGAVATMTTASWEDILTAAIMNNCTGTVEENAALPSAGHIISQAASSKAVYINVADTWAASGEAAMAVTGEVWIAWNYLNDT